MGQAEPGEPSFDDWLRLARRDPVAFEAQRTAVIARTIALAPPARRQRLERLQWRIDRERERYRDPLAACARLSALMWQSVCGRGGLLARLRYLDGRWDGTGPDTLPCARVLPLRRRADGSPRRPR